MKIISSILINDSNYARANLIPQREKEEGGKRQKGASAGSKVVARIREVIYMMRYTAAKRSDCVLVSTGLSLQRECVGTRLFLIFQNIFASTKEK